MDKERFETARQRVLSGDGDGGIGTFGEKSIHSVLKRYYEPENCNHEVKIGSFIADAVGENGIIEIQTRALYKLQKKLDVFLDYCPVTVVHPIIKESRIVKLSESGEVLSIRMSPKKQSIYDAARELYGIRQILDNPRLTVVIPVVTAEDYRIKTSTGEYKKGDKLPLELLEEAVLKTADDWRVFLPEGMENGFTAAEFAKRAGTGKKAAWYCLSVLGRLSIVKKHKGTGRSIFYDVCPPGKI